MHKSKQKRSSATAPAPPQILLRYVNTLANPLSLIPDFDAQSECLYRQIPTRSTIPDDDPADTQPLNLRIICKTWPQLNTPTQNWMLELTETNMSELYQRSAWGWNRSSKLSELKHTSARHLLVYEVDKDMDQANQENLPIAFVHFRFEEGYSSYASLYCYDLQLIKGVRRRGLGALLMCLLQELASLTRMKKLLLTVLKENVEAMKFYTDGLKFMVDQASPSRCGEVADYEILSKKVGLVETTTKKGSKK